MFLFYAFFVFTLTPTLAFLIYKLFSKRLRDGRNDAFDVEDYKVSSTPNVWVFDDLLSEDLLRYVDREFEKKSFASQRKESNLLPNQTRKVLSLDLNSRTKEFNEVIEKIANFIPHETCTRFLICDVAGKDQYAHKDHVEIDALAPEYQKLDYIDKTTLEEGKSRVHSSPGFCSDGDGRFVPTFSIVVYFNAFGSCNFPKSNLNVKGKRGRIIMFQNYVSDAHRPVADDMAIHHGTYEDGHYKRVMTMGILSNKNIDLRKPAETRGILYVPGPRGPRDIAHHHDPNPATYDMEIKPRRTVPEAAYGEGTVLDVSTMVKQLNPNLKKLQDWNFEAVVRKRKYNSSNLQWTYRLQFTHNFVNLYSNIADKYVLGTKMIKESELTQRACGNAEDEAMIYIILTSSLSIHSSESRGWICSCHLCNKKFSKRKAQLDRVLKTLMPQIFRGPEKIAQNASSGNTENRKIWRPNINISNNVRKTQSNIDKLLSKNSSSTRTASKSAKTIRARAPLRPHSRSF